MNSLDLPSLSLATDGDRLRHMVIPDRHRHGPAYGHLRDEQIPIWAIVGYAKAIMEATGERTITSDVIARVAHDYDIGLEAVLASLLSYEEHRAAIDVIVHQNSAR